MSRDIAEFILRDPRYLTADGQQTVVQLLPDGDGTDSILTELVDFSRKGMQVLSDVELQVGDQVMAILRDAASGLDLRLSATVQWQRSADNSKFAIGFQFADEVNWEVLGELFLSGILDQQTAV